MMGGVAILPLSPSVPKREGQTSLLGPIEHINLESISEKNYDLALARRWWQY